LVADVRINPNRAPIWSVADASVEFLFGQTLQLLICGLDGYEWVVAPAIVGIASLVVVVF
jgi:hypothetical protein